MIRKAYSSILLFLALAVSVRAQEQEKVNYGAIATYDELAIPLYSIPDVLAEEDGTPITGVRQWEKRRGAILEMLQKEMYGYMPAHPKGLHFKVGNVDETAIGGKATRKEVKVFLTADESVYFTMLMYVPNRKTGPVPAFLGLNFQGNHTICDDPGITIFDREEIVSTRFEGIPERGSASSRWPVELLMDSGYALATIFYEEIAPDVPGCPYGGVLPLGYGLASDRIPAAVMDREGSEGHPVASDWGTICAWAWGLSCAMDYLVTDPALDPGKIAVLGHSRLGKTSLWAAAMDKRFAMAVSSCSGCCGAAFSRRRVGETLAAVRQNFPQWFAPVFDRYADDESTLPFDQHFLVALIAPRPVYITSASGDIWADPHGEFLSGKLASPAFALYGEKGLVTDPGMAEPVTGEYKRQSGYVITDVDRNGGIASGPARDSGNVISDAILFTGFPRGNTPLTDGFVGYHVRTGVHDIDSYDWQQYITFADKRM